MGPELGAEYMTNMEIINCGNNDKKDVFKNYTGAIFKSDTPPPILTHEHSFETIWLKCLKLADFEHVFNHVTILPYSIVILTTEPHYYQLPATTLLPGFGKSA